MMAITQHSIDLSWPASFAVGKIILPYHVAVNPRTAMLAILRIGPAMRALRAAVTPERATASPIVRIAYIAVIVSPFFLFFWRHQRKWLTHTTPFLTASS